MQEEKSLEHDLNLTLFLYHTETFSFLTILSQVLWLWKWILLLPNKISRAVSGQNWKNIIAEKVNTTDFGVVKCCEC